MPRFISVVSSAMYFLYDGSVGHPFWNVKRRIRVYHTLDYYNSEFYSGIPVRLAASPEKKHTGFSVGNFVLQYSRPWTGFRRENMFTVHHKSKAGGHKSKEAYLSRDDSSELHVSTRMLLQRTERARTQQPSFSLPVTSTRGQLVVSNFFETHEPS